MRVSRKELLARVGTTLANKYRLDRLLGSGGMGAVYGAVNTWTEQKVAVKVLLEPRTNARAVTRFFREARIGARLNHPNIVRVFDIGRAGDGSYFIVQELLYGESLQDRLARDGTLSPGAALRIMIPVLAGLAAAHDAGVVHRDLKPENIFIAGRGGPEVPVIIDFGISKVVEADGKSLTDDFVGTPAYVAPEQALHPAEVGEQADVWAAGAVLYRCLAGEPPFEGTPASVLVAVTTREVPPVQEKASQLLSPELSSVVNRALRRSQEERWSGVAQMVSALLALPIVAEDPELTPLVERYQELVGGSEFAPATNADDSVTVELIAALEENSSLLAVVGGSLEDTTVDREAAPELDASRWSGPDFGALDTHAEDRARPALDATQPDRPPSVLVGEASAPDAGTLTMPADKGKPQDEGNSGRSPGLIRYLPFVVIGLILIAGGVLFMTAFSSEHSREPAAAASAEGPEARYENIASLCDDAAEALHDTRRKTEGYSGVVHVPPTGWATAQSLAGLVAAHLGCGSDGRWVGEATGDLKGFLREDGWGEFGEGQETPAAAWALLAASWMSQASSDDAVEQGDEGGNYRALMVEARAFVLDAQRPDGGFADAADPNSDAYQTAMSLWGLLWSEKVRLDGDEARRDQARAARKRGMDWLRGELEKALFQERGQLDVAAGLPALATIVLYEAWKMGDRRPDDPALFAAAVSRMADDCELNRKASPMSCERDWKANEGVRIHAPNEDRTGIISVVWMPWTVLAAHQLASDQRLPLDDSTRRTAEAIWTSGVEKLNQHADELQHETGFVLSEWAFVLGQLAEHE